jgi:hypothetical protein
MVAIIVLLAAFLVGALPWWRYRQNRAYAPSASVGFWFFMAVFRITAEPS